MSRVIGLPAACAAVPPLAAIGFCAAMLVSAIVGYTPPFWKGGPVTLAEAAALRDQGEVARLIEAGADPDQAYSLRPDVLATTRATPLEAAVAARRPEIVHLLMHEGARMDEGVWRHLHCVALAIGEKDVIDAVDAYQPAAAGADSCPQ